MRAQLRYAPGFAKRRVMNVKIALYAPDGRMGRAIEEEAPAAGALVDNDEADVLVDFSAPDGLSGSIEKARKMGCALLVGTTGLDDGHHAMLKEAAGEMAVLYAPNTSLGVALLADLAERAARVLGSEQWDVEIVEAHHRHKADAPSGTALHLGEAAARGRGGSARDVRGRNGTGQCRENGEIGYAAVRGGTVAGDHDVMFLGPDERVILSHRAENRSVFAKGVIRAAAFLKGQAPGLYSMRDVVEA